MRSVRSDDSIIYSFTSPLHHFYFIHFAFVRYNSNSCGKCGNHWLYHFTAARQSPMIHRTINSIFANTCRSHRSEWKWYTAGSHHFHSLGPLDRKSSDLTLRILKILNSKATLHKHPILWNHQNTLFISWDYPFNPPPPISIVLELAPIVPVLYEKSQL
jgi:hypothetical protein